MKGVSASLTAQNTPSKKAKNPQGHIGKRGDAQETNHPTEKEGSTLPPIPASGRTHAPEAATDRGSPEASLHKKQTKPKGGTHAQTATTIVEATKGEDTRSEERDRTGRDDKRSGGGPPPEATEHEGGTGIPSDAGSIEGLSTSESSLSSEDTTPPIVVMVVPGTG